MEPEQSFSDSLYQRLSLSVTYANDFIRYTNGNTDPAVMQYNAEARFLKGSCLYLGYGTFLLIRLLQQMLTELENSFQNRFRRANLFNYVVSELHSIETKLALQSFRIPEADQGCLLDAAGQIISEARFTTRFYYMPCTAFQQIWQLQNLLRQSDQQRCLFSGYKLQTEFQRW